MPSPGKTIRLCAKDHIGKVRINMAKHRLKHWDGMTWAVTALPVPEACQARMHVRPLTDQATDWLGFWMLTTNDPHVVTTNQFS